MAKLPSPTLEAISLPKKGRGLLLGKTDSGKSTLAEVEIWLWLRQYPKSRILIADSKPRFRAEWEINGVSTAASRRYKGWEYGTPWPDSVVLPYSEHPAISLRRAWAAGYHVAIAQVASLRHLDFIRAAIGAFYTQAHARYPALCYVDEVADYFAGSGLAGRGDELLQVWRSGREKNLAGLGASQRPKGIPKSLLTETTILALFALAYAQDIEHIWEMGLPPTAHIPAQDHVFYHVNLKTGAEGDYILSPEVIAAAQRGDGTTGAS